MTSPLRIDPPEILPARLETTRQGKHVLIIVECHLIGVVIFSRRVHLLEAISKVKVVLLRQVPSLEANSKFQLSFHSLVGHPVVLSKLK